MRQRDRSDVAVDYAAWANFFHGLRHKTRTGDCLIGLGEVVDFFERVALEIESLDSDERVDVGVIVTLSAVLRQGDGLLMIDAELSDERFVLSQTGHDFDSYSRRMHAWPPCFGITFDDCGEWRDLFNEVLGQGRLQVSRDHV